MPRCAQRPREICCGLSGSVNSAHFDCALGGRRRRTPGRQVLWMQPTRCRTLLCTRTAPPRTPHPSSAYVHGGKSHLAASRYVGGCAAVPTQSQGNQVRRRAAPGCAAAAPAAALSCQTASGTRFCGGSAGPPDSPGEISERRAWGRVREQAVPGGALFLECHRGRHQPPPPPALGPARVPSPHPHSHQTHMHAHAKRARARARARACLPMSRRAAFSYAMPLSVSFFCSTSGSPRLVATMTCWSSGIAPSSGTPSISCGARGGSGGGGARGVRAWPGCTAHQQGPPPRRGQAVLAPATRRLSGPALPPAPTRK